MNASTTLQPIVEVDDRSTKAIEPTAAPRVRAAVAVLMTRFPRIDETFILREINELERAGQPVLVVPVARGETKIVHEEAKPWLKRALFVPFLSPLVIASNVSELVREPRRYLRVLWRLVAATWHRPSTFIRTLALFPKAVHLARILPRRGIRHVHAHFASHATTMAHVIAAFSDITYSFTVHGPDVFVHRLLLRDKIRDAAFIRSVSLFNKAFLSGLYPVEVDRKIEVVHSGVNPDVYADAAARSRRNGGRPMLLSIAALTPNRGFEFLVDACARLIRAGAELECRIVGEGPMRETIQESIERHGISGSMRLLGVLPQHEIARLMGECDIFVLPSIIAMDGQMDGLPISLMEAMAAGKPVIASSIAGIPELVTHDVSGLLVDAAYAERLARAIRRLIEDPALRERLGRAGQEKVREQFDIRRNARALIELLDTYSVVNEPDKTAAARIASLSWSRLNTCALGVRRVHERARDFVAEVTITNGITQRDVVVRQPRGGEHGPSALDLARARFEVLSVLRGTLASHSETGGIAVEYSVPRVLMFDEPNAALVLERADGISLARLVTEARTRGRARRLAIALRKAGTWLRVMQGHTRRDDDARHLLRTAVEVALRDLELAAAGDRRMRQQCTAAQDALRSLESRVAERAMAIVGHHGDYRPDNVFIGERRVVVTDFGCYREGLPLEDVAQMLVHLEIRFANPFVRRYLPMLRSSFLNGYAGGDPIDEETLTLFTIASAAQQLARGGTTDDPLEQWWRRRVLRRLIATNVT